jgi:uncharacterized membrane protein YedE/YeeE
MMDDYEKQRRQKATGIRSVLDYIMGFLLLGIGIYFLIYERMGWTLMNRPPSDIDKFFGGLLVIYGIWRIYRGYKKNYYKGE